MWRANREIVLLHTSKSIRFKARIQIQSAYNKVVGKSLIRLRRRRRHRRHRRHLLLLLLWCCGRWRSCRWSCCGRLLLLVILRSCGGVRRWFLYMHLTIAIDWTIFTHFSVSFSLYSIFSNRKFCCFLFLRQNIPLTLVSHALRGRARNNITAHALTTGTQHDIELRIFTSSLWEIFFFCRCLASNYWIILLHQFNGSVWMEHFVVWPLWTPVRFPILGWVVDIFYFVCALNTNCLLFSRFFYEWCGIHNCCLLCI